MWKRITFDSKDGITEQTFETLKEATDCMLFTKHRSIIVFPVGE